MAIRVLIVDDSLVFRQILAKGMQSDPQIQVVATATDPFDARDKILEFEPDVVTCDIEMPKMNGIEFVRRLIPQYPIPVIVVSSISDKVFDAMDAGAVGFAAKPNAMHPEDVQKFILDLIQSVKEASKAKVEIRPEPLQDRSQGKVLQKHELIAIGASTGGTEAIYSLLKQLPTGLPGIVIVQHIPPVFSRLFAERLNNQTPFVVKEATHGDRIEKDHIYVAPGDKHVEVRKSEKGYYLKVFEGEKVSGHCPSVDVLFHSVAEAVGERALGVILTGMGYDGAKGMAMMRRKGAMTIGQDEKSCVVYGMPKVAYELNGVMKQCSLERMGRCVMEYLR
ncbi:MAG: chemotaxis response regulator protein-glutamate methylesterase [Vallitaleaceae bacterium]|nr:chemotaxis response regulator protein-glutamate methylesterase [Vallitaleaceae bacterium]